MFGEDIKDLDLSVVWEDARMDRSKKHDFLLLVVRHSEDGSWRCAGLLVQPSQERGQEFSYTRLGLADVHISENQGLKLCEEPQRTVFLV